MKKTDAFESEKSPRIAYLVYQYPTLTQTFIQREIAGVARNGFFVEIHALRFSPPPADFALAPGTLLRTFHFTEIPKLLWKLPLEILRRPSLVWKGVRLLFRCPPKSLENTWINLLGFVVAVIRASEFRRSEVVHFHGAWATGAATAAGILGFLCRKSFSFGGHAFDLYRNGGDAYLLPKLRTAAFIHTTTEANVRHLQKLAGKFQVKVVLARRGLERLPEAQERTEHEGPVRLLSVARLVEKKAHSDQIRACVELKRRRVRFELKIIGEGSLREALEAQIRESNLEREVELCGARPPAEVCAAYQWADIFLHTGGVDSEGDRDGLPNVIPEAFSHRLAVISSPTPGADEAVHHLRTGWVVNTRDSRLLADAIEMLAAQSNLRRELGNNGFEWVRRHFLVDQNTAILADAFRRLIPATEQASAFSLPLASTEKAG